MKLTKRNIDALHAPANGSKLVRDSDVPGFGIRIQAATSRSPSGKRTFFFNYHNADGYEKRVTIGDYGVWTCEAARDRAKELRRAVDRGEDPASERRDRRVAPSVAELAERYVAEHLPKKAKSSQDARIIDRHIIPRLGSLKVAGVHHGDAAALHAYVTKHHGRVIANRVLALFSKMMSIAATPMPGEIEAWFVGTNPCSKVERNAEVGVERFFSAQEIAEIGNALATYPNQDTADVVRMIMLCGCRPSEAMRMKWTDISDGVWTKPGLTTKTKTTHRFFLPAPALELLSTRPRDSEYVFPSTAGHIVNLRKVWNWVRKHAKIKGRLYDCRHSYASILAAGGTSLFIISKLLNHSNVRTSQRYSHLSDSPLRDAASRAGDTIGAAINQKSAVVVPLKRSSA